mmetsp:Transcript_20345/g.38266  ORF Transcript_20345/g.38266 Transcript_20345/m.38266 type:complete len:217 (+) Transcript_20345:161-811(+)
MPVIFATRRSQEVRQWVLMMQDMCSTKATTRNENSPMIRKGRAEWLHQLRVALIVVLMTWSGREIMAAVVQGKENLTEGFPTKRQVLKIASRENLMVEMSLPCTLQRPRHHLATKTETQVPLTQKKCRESIMMMKRRNRRQCKYLPMGHTYLLWREAVTTKAEMIMTKHWSHHHLSHLVSGHLSMCWRKAVVTKPDLVRMRLPDAPLADFPPGGGA